MKEKRKYEKPSQRVIKLQHQGHLLAGSDAGGKLNLMGEPEDL